MKKSENVCLLVLKFSSKTKFLLLFFRLFQKFSLNLRKRRSRSLLSLFFLSRKWKSLIKNKISRYLNNFVSVSLICDKVHRSALFNSSMISAILSVEKYDFANSVTIIVNRFSVSMSVSFRLSVKNKKRNSAFAFVKFSILKSFDVVFSSTFFDVLFVFSTFFDVVSAFFARFFVSFSSDYRDSFSVRRCRFLSKISQKRFHVSFHVSINLKKKKCKIFFEFLKNSDLTAKTVEIFSILIWFREKFRIHSLRRVASRLKAALRFLRQTWFDL